IRMMQRGTTHTVDLVGYFTPKKIMTESLLPGEMGFFTAAMKEVADCKIGDTVTDEKNPANEALPGFKPNLPVVFCSLFPMDSAEYDHLRDSLGKLRLNDSSFEY